MNVLYILMRTDMDSMNPGKAMAQASHASNAFVFRFGRENLVKQWQGETQQGFGTVLVLDVTGDQMNDVVHRVKDDLRFKEEVYADIIHDPTYPIQDGDVVHHIPVDTCAYVFGDKDSPDLQDLLSGLELHSTPYTKNSSALDLIRY